MSTKDCRDLIKKNISEYLPKDVTPEEFFINLDNTKASNSIGRILNAAVNLFQCKIAMLHKEENNYLYRVTDCSMEPTEAPLYILSERFGKFFILFKCFVVDMNTLLTINYKVN